MTIRRQRRAKIVATLGPASSTEAMIHALFVAGADVFRLNFSHGTHEAHRTATADRQRRAQCGSPDRCSGRYAGPKLRVGTFANGPVSLAEVDSDPHYRELLEASQTRAQATTADAICKAMNTIAGLLPVAAIVTYTTSGSTSLRAARERPLPNIVSMTPNLATARSLALSWAVHSVQTPDVATVAEMVERACQCAMAEGFAKPGDTILISAGMPFGTPGATNLLRIATV